jgi:hypothetical protein
VKVPVKLIDALTWLEKLHQRMIFCCDLLRSEGSWVVPRMSEFQDMMVQANRCYLPPFPQAIGRVIQNPGAQGYSMRSFSPEGPSSS